MKQALTLMLTERCRDREKDRHHLNPQISLSKVDNSVFGVSKLSVSMKDFYQRTNCIDDFSLTRNKELDARFHLHFCLSFGG